MAKFALGFGNRGFFPAKYMKEAREELPTVLEALGHKSVMMHENATRLGAVEEEPEGRRWAEWFDGVRGSVDGIIWTHPNFGNEAGMRPALYKAGKSGVPILLHAYPDDMTKLGRMDRRDSFCGKMSTMDVLTQFQVPFVALTPHVVAPSSPEFVENIKLFTAIAEGRAQDPFKKVDFESPFGGRYGTNVLEDITLLAIGARTSPFQTCRYDELVAAKNGINIQTQDLATIMDEMKAIKADDPRMKAKMEVLGKYSCWTKAFEMDPKTLEKQARFAVIMDEYIAKYQPKAIGARCWTEWQALKEWKMSICATLSHLNHGREDGNMIPAACEVDVGNALAGYVMKLAGAKRVATQDWNNNWYNERDKFAFMHCGPHDTAWLDPKAKLMYNMKGHYVDTQAILDVSFGGPTPGCIQGRFKPGPVTVGSATIGPGNIFFYFLEGKVTKDVIPPEYFGSAGVLEAPMLQEALLQIGHQGYKHHFEMCDGHVAEKCIDMLNQHPGYKVMDLRPANLEKVVG